MIVSDGKIEVIDLKYGKGVRVEAKGNPQMHLYALGVVSLYGCLYDMGNVTTTIYQPRLGNVSSAAFPVGELLEWAADEVSPLARLAAKGRGVRQSGYWCRFCKAKNKWPDTVRLDGEKFKRPLKDGDTYEDSNGKIMKDKDAAFAGAMFLNPSSKTPVYTCNRLKQKIDPAEVYSGCWCLLSVNFFPFDKSTFEACRLMFWPSRSSDGDWLFEEGEGEFLSPDKVLATYRDWRDMAEWPLLPEEDLGGLFGDKATGQPPVTRRGHGPGSPEGMRQEDPRGKTGLVGAFCRAYTVGEAIERFMPEAYSRSGGSRWTHNGSTTHGGAQELDGGRFLYSYHATDPLRGRLLNSWDLVRLHRFGHLDTETAQPSKKKMEELALGDPKVKTLMMDERRAQALADFADVTAPTAQEEQSAQEEPVEDRYAEWNELRGRMLRVKKDGTTVTDPASLLLVLSKHPDIAGKFRYDDFAGMVEVVGELPWRHSGKYWNNRDDSCFRSWLGTELGMGGREMVYDALVTYANTHGIHPVREYLDSLEWDGVERCATSITHVLGAEDTELNREQTLLFFTAAVRRIKEPGCKYDEVLTLQGEEGTGKSSFFRILGGKWFSDSPINIGDKEGMAALQGVWIYELAELTSLKKKEADAIKGFLSSQVDKFRPAFGRQTEWRERQTVFGGTTNEDLFLKGVYNDNRRQPVIHIDPALRKVEQSRVTDSQKDTGGRFFRRGGCLGKPRPLPRKCARRK